MRVLFISEQYTHPQDAGNKQRIYSICCMMKKLGWEVDFLYVGDKNIADWSAMQSYFGKKHLFYMIKDEIEANSHLKASVRDILNKKGISKYFALKYSENEWYRKSIEDRVYVLMKNKSYDIVCMNYFFQSSLFDKIGENVLKVIEAQDKFNNRNKLFQKFGKVPEFFYTTYKGEKKALSRADVVIAIQENEERIFSKMLSKTPVKVTTIGNVIDLNKTGITKQKTYGLIGANNGPNIMGFNWFIDKVFPIINEKMPDSRFIVAGGMCNKIPDSDKYEKRGYVDSLEEFYGEVRCVINPVINGTGLNIKSIEALAYTKPLVSTSVGAKGLDKAKAAILTDDSPEIFAQNVIKLLEDDNICVTMMKEAEKFVVDYNDDNEKKMLEIQELAEKKRKK